jgi:putative endonuclease
LQFKESSPGALIGESPFNKNRLPVCLIYYECCLNKYDAIRRERFLKSGQGRRYLKKRLKDFLINIKQKE